MKTSLLVSLALLAAVTNSACSSAAKATKLNNLSIGMSKDDVLAVMGAPYTTTANANQTDLIYRLKDPTGKPLYFVRMVDGKVSMYGRVGDYESTKHQPDLVVEKHVVEKSSH